MADADHQRNIFNQLWTNITLDGHIHEMATKSCRVENNLYISFCLLSTSGFFTFGKLRTNRLSIPSVISSFSPAAHDVDDDEDNNGGDERSLKKAPLYRPAIDPKLFAEDDSIGAITSNSISANNLFIDFLPRFAPSGLLASGTRRI